jgi:hypothetical protein
MANGTSTSHARPTLAEILEPPGRPEAYLAEVAAWAHDRIGAPGAEPGRPGAITITGNTESAPARRQVTDALLDEAGWLAERLTAARAADRTWIAHLLVFTGLGRETAVLSEVGSELRPGLLHQGIVIEEFHRARISASVRDRNYSARLSPWPCFALSALIPRHD